MKKSLVFLLLLAAVFMFSCKRSGSGFQVAIPSPDLTIHIYFALEKGKPFYMVYHKDEIVLDWSPLGYVFAGGDTLSRDLVIAGTESGAHREEWKPVWGQTALCLNEYNEYKIHLREKSGLKRKFSICFRAFNDGFGFRYIFPEQESADSVFITSELTGFNMAGNGTAWWIPGDFDSYEHLFRTTAISEIDSANTPLTLKLAENRYISIHEADLSNYPGMTIKRTGETKFSASLVPWPDGIKVKTEAPFVSPWRTVQIAEKPGDLITSCLILNLNEPNRIEDTSWIKPMKYIGIWWGMHLGIHTWHEGPRHGATTARAKEYIDFAAKHNIGGVLAEGWNTGWDSWFNGDKFDFVTPYPDFNLPEVTRYAQEKGVSLIGHHETGGHVPNYEKHMDSAFALYHSLGIHAVKTGYAGKIRPEGQHHHGQFMVNHYQKVVELAAKNRIMIDAHEPVKPTGLSRTWPNMMTREGVRGMEWNAWSEGNPPEHTTIIPFTRMLGGPVDYTPGIFDILCVRHAGERKKWNEAHLDKTRVHSTLANQLALYVVLYSPLQMAADLPGNYKDHPAFAFIEEAPVNWDVTQVLDAEIGDYITIVRKSGNNWYIGSVTDENERTMEVPMDFLSPGIDYLITLYEDGENTDLETNPADFAIREIRVKKSDTLTIKMTSGGGFAAIARPAQ
ncbi:MAG: glycoside hydrolase family 97 protein [Bacteroidales bacterium]|nr:glycoside hydrolase family 97 protein [Bacteroidales bacterium]